MINIQIVMLSTLSPSGGGRETWLGQFVPQFLKAHNVHFEICAIGSREREMIVHEGASVSLKSVWGWRRIMPWPLLFLMGYIYHSAVRRHKVNVIVAVGGLSEALPVTIVNFLFRRNTRCVLWLRTIYMKEKAPRIPRIMQRSLAAVEKALVKRFDVVIANGKDTASFYRSYRPDVVVIENSVEVDLWRNSQKVYRGGAIHVSFIGRVTDIKGIREFIEACALLKKKGATATQFRFTVLGACEEHRKEELGLSNPDNGVEYLGRVANDQVPHFLKTVDVCVNLTYGTGEFMGGGVSNALLEQMAAGKPQIVWDNPIYRNVTDEGFALFAQERDITSLVACLEKLWHIRSELPVMSQLAMARAQEFGWKQHIAKAAAAFFENDTDLSGSRTYTT